MITITIIIAALLLWTLIGWVYITLTSQLESFAHRDEHLWEKALFLPIKLWWLIMLVFKK